MSSSPEVPLDEEFEAPPGLTHSAGSSSDDGGIHSAGSSSNDGGTVDDVSVGLATLILAPPVPRNEKRFVTFLSRAVTQWHHLSQDARDSLVANRAQDLLEAIFNHLPLKSDQRALALVDQSTRYILYPKLYNTVTLNMASYPANLSAVTSLFSRQNQGLVHVKRIIFDSSYIVDKTNPPAGFNCLASMAIENVAPSKLEYFDWPADFTLPAMFSVRLMDQQVNLKNLQLYDDTLNVRGAERKETLETLDKVVCLRISPEDSVSLRHTSHIMRKKPLVELHLELRTYAPRQTLLDFNNDPAAKDLEVVQLLFRHAVPLYACPRYYQLPLKRLVLWDVNLARSSQTWHKVMMEKVLREVEISNCAWPGKFFYGLANVQPFLLKVKVHHDDALDDPTKLPATPQKHNSFMQDLESFLKTIVTTHKTTLKAENQLHWLEVHLKGPARAYDASFFGRVGLHSSALDVLCIDMFVDDSKAHSSKTMDGSPALSAHLFAQLRLGTCNASYLRQLCYSNFVFANPTTNLDGINPVTLMLLECSGTAAAQTVANAALLRLRATHKEKIRLRVLAVKCNHQAPVTTYFVKHEAVVLGCKTEMMVTVTYKQLKKYEQEIDMLEPAPVVIGGYGRV